MGERSSLNSYFLASWDKPIAVDDTTNKIYDVIAISNIVSVIDGNNDTVIKQVKVGENPLSVKVESIPHKIFVLNGNNTVSVSLLSAVSRAS